MSEQDPAAGAAGGPERRIEVDGSVWIVRSGGTGAAGTGPRGPALVEALHFYRPGDVRPRLEALLARGIWTELFDEELVRLLRGATPVPPPG